MDSPCMSSFNTTPIPKKRVGTLCWNRTQPFANPSSVRRDIYCSNGCTSMFRFFLVNVHAFWISMPATHPEKKLGQRNVYQRVASPFLLTPLGKHSGTEGTNVERFRKWNVVTFLLEVQFLLLNSLGSPQSYFTLHKYPHSLYYEATLL